MPFSSASGRMPCGAWPSATRPQLFRNVFEQSTIPSYGRMASLVTRASAATDPAAARSVHNTRQAEYFSREIKALQASITPKIEAQLAMVAESVPGLGPASRVLDAGAGDGALIPHLQQRGVQDVLAVDVCPAMIDALTERLGNASVLGNEPAVRTWVGDVVDLPSYLGPFDVAFFNAVFGNLHDQREALLKTCFLLRPGSYIVISHPLGRKWLDGYRRQNPEVVPHSLPSKSELENLVHELPLEIIDYKDGEDLYLVLLRVPEGYALPAGPVHLNGEVITGFGRGSKQLGVPTANLPPVPLEEKLASLPTGVYFGWAQLDPGEGAPHADSQVHKMVMNVGRRPTFEDKEPELSVEVHIMHSFASDFYGKPLNVVALGYLRPEIRFSGLQELLARIHTDIGIAKAQLDLPMWSKYQNDDYFK